MFELIWSIVIHILILKNSENIWVKWGMRAYSNFLESRSMRRKLFCCDHHHKKRWGFIHSCPAQTLHPEPAISGWFTGPAEHFQIKWGQIYLMGAEMTSCVCRQIKWPFFIGASLNGSGKNQKYWFFLLGLKYTLRTCFESKKLLSKSCPELSNFGCDFHTIQGHLHSLETQP